MSEKMSKINATCKLGNVLKSFRSRRGMETPDGVLRPKSAKPV